MASTFLAVVTDPWAVSATLDAAAKAVLDPATRITVLHVKIDPHSLILPTEEVMTEKRRAELQDQIDQRADAVKASFDAWMASNGAPPRLKWQQVEGSVRTEVARLGRSSDLLVLGRPGENEGHEALGAALFEVRRLSLLVPPQGPTDLGRHIAIAWKDDETAMRAVTAAIPWLKAAHRVSLIIAGEAEATDAEATDLLSEHGVSAEIHRVADPGHAPIGEVRLCEAHAAGADCLVMGAYRHSRMLELILGGATRHLLRAADLPVFLMH